MQFFCGILICWLNLLLWSQEGNFLVIEESDLQIKSFKGKTWATFYGEGEKVIEAELLKGLPIDDAPLECDQEGVDVCIQWGDQARLHVNSDYQSNATCHEFEWSGTLVEWRDCFIIDGHYVYGGPEQYRQEWPINNVSRPEVPYVTGDMLSSPTGRFGGIIEPYWLTSRGAVLYVTHDVPLFYSFNNDNDGRLCLTAKHEYPYINFNETTRPALKHTVCWAGNVKEAHLVAIDKFLPKPTAAPDEHVLLNPVWSTWAQYKTNIDRQKVLEFAGNITKYGFTYSHLEIDDNWETCYGDATFDEEKFGGPENVTDMVSILKDQNFTVTLWVHPFINPDCDSYQEAADAGYFVKRPDGTPGSTNWWQGVGAGIIDFSNPAAVQWWNGRLEALRQTHGFDAFKFDAGETNWLPGDFSFEDATSVLWPNSYSTDYVNAVSSFGDQIEVRVGWANQENPILFRMLDKNSNWSYDVGLKSLIPTLFQFGIVGYPFVLPDMIGGNGYVLKPGHELYLRWAQANVLMSSVQYSYVPWEYDETPSAVDVVLELQRIRQTYKEHLSSAVEEAVTFGYPINRPLWWLDPTIEEALLNDNEYLLGDDLLVAPVVDQLPSGQTVSKRDVYIPTGNWRNMLTGETTTGPTTLYGVEVPLDKVIYYERVKEE